MITQLNLNFIKPDEIQLDGKRIYLKYDVSPQNPKTPKPQNPSL